MSEKFWDILNSQKLNSPKEIIKALLKNRGIVRKADIVRFLHPPHPTSFEAPLLGIDKKSIKIAVKRIETAIRKDEQIVIYGDYDADGVCASAILWETLYKYSKNVVPHIPDRFSEGYGINPKSVEILKSKIPNLKLIITVDNGIVAFDGVKEAVKSGIDVIVTDHHEKEKLLPEALSVIHTTKLSGSGISWFFSSELIKHLKDKEGFKNHLELAAIGTVADQLPLVGPNRSIVKHGLVELNSTKRPGLIALINQASAVSKKDNSEINTYDIGFVLAPRINAMGRIEHAIDSLRLLCTNDPVKAKNLAEVLGRTNESRQGIVQDVLQRSKKVTVKKNEAITISGEYQEGVIGLAAGKLAEEYYLPAVVISEGKTVSKASARSIPGFNIIKAIREMGDVILGGGGHSMAAGFSIETERIPEFKKKFAKLSRKFLTDEILRRKVRIDLELDIRCLNMALLDEIARFEPFGYGNPSPQFILRKAFVTDAQTVGKDKKHLRVEITKEGLRFIGIGFGLGNYFEKLHPGKLVDIVFSLDKNTWNGNTTVQLIIKDIEPSGKVCKSSNAGL